MMLPHYMLYTFAVSAGIRMLSATNFFKNGETKDTDLKKLPEATGDGFYYFSYGSDMLRSYLETEVSSFDLVGPALLRYHRLDFNTQSPRWSGALATIVIDVSSDIYGTLWKVNLTDLNRLNRLESVPHPVYVPYRTPVSKLDTKEVVIARTYHLRQNPIDSIYNFGISAVPTERLPSKSYLRCMVKGAVENGLPPEYIDFLRRLKHNEQDVKEMEYQHNLKNVELKSVKIESILV